MRSFESDETSIERTGSCEGSEGPRDQFRRATAAEDKPSTTHLVSVEGEEELERVLVKDLDCRVEKRDGEQLAVGCVPDREDVVRHLESLRVDEREDLFLELEDVRTTKAGQNFVHLERRYGG